MISALRRVPSLALLACTIVASSALIAQQTAPAALPYRGEQPARASWMAGAMTRLRPRRPNFLSA